MDLADLILNIDRDYENLSDIHIQGEEPAWVRAGGLMRSLDLGVIHNDNIVSFLEKALNTNTTLEQFLAKKKDTDFAFELGHVRFRANLFKVRKNNLALSLRKINDNIPDLDDLRVPDKVREVSHRSKGLFLVTGPTGSGKSTTLATIVNEINKTRNGHIITIEDPIEYIHRSKACKVAQREIGTETDSFASALRSALRQDPDVILIGELRDKATVETALSAAETGHLVLATLHTVNARQSIDRLTSFYAGDEKAWIQQVLSSVLVGVLSQVLVEGLEPATRHLATEFLAITGSTRQCIRDGQTHLLSNLMETGKSEGQQLLNWDLARLVENHDISAENALYYAYDRVTLERALGLGGNNYD